MPLFGASGAVALEAGPTASATRVTAVPLPRPAMIRTDANLRLGPGLEYPILARIEDGQQAWVHTAMPRQN